jgi:hypothetical protein
MQHRVQRFEHKAMSMNPGIPVTALNPKPYILNTKFKTLGTKF